MQIPDFKLDEKTQKNVKIKIKTHQLINLGTDFNPYSYSFNPSSLHIYEWLMPEKSPKIKSTPLDLEKNELTIQPSPLKPRSKTLLSFITIIEFISLLIVIKHREVIDNVHQLLNSILLGIITATLGQSIIQLFRQVHYDRIGKFFIWGAINGVLSSLWIDCLVYKLPDVLSRVLVDQLVGSPLFQLLFIVLNCLWENTDISIAMKTVSIYEKFIKFKFEDLTFYNLGVYNNFESFISILANMFSRFISILAPAFNFPIQLFDQLDMECSFKFTHIKERTQQYRKIFNYSFMFWFVDARIF